MPRKTLKQVLGTRIEEGQFGQCLNCEEEISCL
jgi:RNA polymerase-binding transcription factor DksA